MLHRPSSGHGLLRYLEQSLGLQGVVKSLVGGQNDIFGGGQRVGVLCLFLKLGRGHQVDGAPKVGDELD